MQREIKFRGKRVENGAWVYGQYFNVKKQGFYVGIGHYILPENSVFANKVNPKTIGQYTGLKDKNGQEIFEGDITDEGIIEYWEGKYVVMQSNGQCWDDLCWCYNKIEVLGNIQDNPELLGGDGNDNHT